MFFSENSTARCRKQGYTWSKSGFSAKWCVPLTDNLVFAALDLKERYQFGWFDSLIAASALEAKCKFLYSEDFQDGLLIEGQMMVVNPFLI